MSDAERNSGSNNGGNKSPDIRTIADILDGTVGGGVGASTGTDGPDVGGGLGEAKPLGDYGAELSGNVESSGSNRSSDRAGKASIGGGGGNSSGGSGAKRVNRTGPRNRSDNARTGTGTGKGTGTGTQKTRTVADEETPGRVIVLPTAGKGKKGKKATSATEATDKQMILMFLQTLNQTAYSAVATMRNEPHWHILKSDALELAKRELDCLEQLPTGMYEDVLKIINNYAPWVGLAITAAAITMPRVERSRANKRTGRTAKQATNANATTSDRGNGTGDVGPDGFEWQTHIPTDSNPFEYGAANSFHGGPKTDGQ